MPSHQEVSDENILFVKQFRESGIGVADAFHVLKKQSRGSLCLECGLRDVYNKLEQFKNRRFDGKDANSLIEILNRHFKYEDDFHFTIELDENNCLVSFFLCDTQMLEDYILFGYLIIFDMTYRMNKYDMIYTLFVRMNHHSMNIILGCGFL